MKLLATLFAALLMTLTLPAWADVSREQAATLAQGNGRVLAVEKTEHEGRPVWRVKVLTPQGEVKVVLVDVASGRTQ